MEFLSRTAAGIAVNIREFDTDPWVFNCANCTIDLRANDFRPHEHADMITNISPVEYDPKAEWPLWESFLSDVMAGDREMMGFLQRAAGYSLTGSTAQHCMFICWGTGRNGKSTFPEVLRHVIGTYGKQASMATFLAKKSDEGIPNDLAALQGARFVTGIETEDGKRLAEAKSN
jgi:putative DNA primase/helicase